MAQTITRGATVLTPALIVPGRLTRPGRSVVHAILGDPEPDVTLRAPGLRTGDIRTLWATPAAALAAVAALGAPGGSWTIAGAGDADMVMKVVGDIVIEPTSDGMASRAVTITVQEVSA